MAQCTLGNEVLTGSFLGWWGEDGPTEHLHVLLRGRDGETWSVGGEGGETTQQRNGLEGSGTHGHVHAAPTISLGTVSRTLDGGMQGPMETWNH